MGAPCALRFYFGDELLQVHCRSVSASGMRTRQTIRAILALPHHLELLHRAPVALIQRGIPRHLHR
jgi:hypothetical protein